MNAATLFALLALLLLACGHPCPDLGGCPKDPSCPAGTMAVGNDCLVVECPYGTVAVTDTHDGITDCYYHWGTCPPGSVVGEKNEVGLCFWIPECSPPRELVGNGCMYPTP